ncbi:MAG: hypothetical protein CMI31_14615 [Opitutae bacterium]|nr:hypothetical protein [Opitutae bacterium]|tara:strand:+ start:1311 stop:2762 length:1452 start_codon:yes stop_codon:yes gene_type:complete
MRYLINIILISQILSAQEVFPRYWNSLSTFVTVGIPIADDESLIGGRIQVKVSFNGGESFSDLGERSVIEKGEIDDIKAVTIPANVFENMSGFQEGAKAEFIAQVWDKAGNSRVGSVSDSILSIDQILPELVTLDITSSNALDPSKIMPGDSITFQVNANEAIKPPIININGEVYDGSVGLDKSWMLVYPADEAEDGTIDFQVNYTDLAGNPGQSITQSTNGESIIKDGTLPELSAINLSTSNLYDGSLGIEGDTVFLTFKSSEPIRDIVVFLNSIEGKVKKEESLVFTYYHVFTKSDSEGVIPISIDYTDLAGNIGETHNETMDDSEVTLDMNPPAEFQVEMVGSLQGEIKKKSNNDKAGKKQSNNKEEELGLIPIIILSVFASTILIVWISFFKIFSKAGQAGWKAFIPFFNIFVFTKIVGKPVWWLLIYLLIPVGYILSAIQIGKLFGKNLLFSIGLILVPLVFYPLIAFGKAQVIEPNK